MFCAVPSEPAPFQSLRIRLLKARWAEHGEVAADFRKLFRRVRLLGRVIRQFRHFFARMAQRKTGVNGGENGPLDWPEPRGKTFLKVLVGLSKQKNNIAFLRQGYSNPMRQRKDIAVQQIVYVVPVEPDD
jgi:hypothetical protein